MALAQSGDGGLEVDTGWSDPELVRVDQRDRFAGRDAGQFGVERPERLTPRAEVEPLERSALWGPCALAGGAGSPLAGTVTGESFRPRAGHGRWRTVAST